MTPSTEVDDTSYWLPYILQIMFMQGLWNRELQTPAVFRVAGVVTPRGR